MPHVLDAFMLSNSWKSGIDGQLDVQELHRDLARKHRNVGGKVDGIWRNFTSKQREKAVRSSIGDGNALEHSRDDRLGVLCEYIPEYNLRDMTSAPEHFLDIFKFRATTESLYEQLYEGVNGRPGDRELMESTGLRYSQTHREEKTFFIGGELYGQNFKPGPAAGGVFHMPPDEDADSFILPSAVGRMIIVRQQYLFQLLNHLVEEILRLGSAETKNKTSPSKKVNEALVSAVSSLSLQPKPLRSSFPEVRAQAVDSKTALEDYLLLLRDEPIVLNQAVNSTYWSRTELVPDGQGRILPAMTDRHLSTALYDSVTTAVEAIAIWDYILCLLQLLEDASEKVKRGLVLQELSNTCHLEYRRI